MKISATSRKARDLDLEALLHPAGAFERPIDVVKDADLTLNEKRAILASWASDACAVEAAPALRRVPGGGRPVSIDEILDALHSLDRQAQRDGSLAERCHRIERRRSVETWRSLRNAARTRVRGRRGLPDEDATFTAR